MIRATLPSAAARVRPGWPACVGAVALGMLLAWSAGARAEIPDDFRGGAIDAERWTVLDPARMLSQENGRLGFHGTGRTSARIVSQRTFGAGFFSVRFREFRSSNASPGGKHEGSYAALGFGLQHDYVRVLRGAVRSGGYFEANHFTNGEFRVWWVNAIATSGQLALYWDGTSVSFFYNTGVDVSAGWQRVGPTVTPGWTAPPSVFLGGSPGSSGTTSFVLEELRYEPGLPSITLPGIR